MLPGKFKPPTSNVPRSEEFSAPASVQGARVAIPPIVELLRFLVLEEEVHNETELTGPLIPRSVRLLSSHTNGSRTKTVRRSQFFSV